MGLCLKLCPDPASVAATAAGGEAKGPARGAGQGAAEPLSAALQRLSPSEVGAGADGAGAGAGWLARLAAYALFRTVLTLPAVVRAVWGEDLTRLAKQVRLLACLDMSPVAHIQAHQPPHLTRLA